MNDLYKELLEFGKERIDDFFKNVKLYENQFKYDEFNDACYDLMYQNNSYEKGVSTVKELKESIPGLKETCKKCGSYYMVARNKSIVAYDVQMGILLENIIIDFLKEKFHIKALHGDKSNKKYPDCMVLSKDKGIVAYFEVKYHSAPFIMAYQKINRLCYEGSATFDQDKIIKQLEIIDSDIQLPTFYLHWIDYPCLKGLFFETNEQVKDYIYRAEAEFERKEREGDLAKSAQSIYLGKVYAPTLSMGTFDEFVSILKKLEVRH